MFALLAAIVLFLRAVSVLDDTFDVDWVLVGLACWALHFAVPISFTGRRQD